jgi:hypothetical protein
VFDGCRWFDVFREISSSNNNSPLYAVCVLHESLLLKLNKTLNQDIHRCASCVLVVTDMFKSCADVNRHYGISPTATIKSNASFEEVFRCVQVRKFPLAPVSVDWPSLNLSICMQSLTIRQRPRSFEGTS